MANEHMKRCSTSFSHQKNANHNHNDVTLEMYQESYHQNNKVTSTGEDVEKVETSKIVGGNVIQYSQFGSQKVKQNDHTIQQFYLQAYIQEE